MQMLTPDRSLSCEASTTTNPFSTPDGGATSPSSAANALSAPDSAAATNAWTSRRQQPQQGTRLHLDSCASDHSGGLTPLSPLSPAVAAHVHLSIKSPPIRSDIQPLLSATPAAPPVVPFQAVLDEEERLERAARLAASKFAVKPSLNLIAVDSLCLFNNRISLLVIECYIQQYGRVVLSTILFFNNILVLISLSRFSLHLL